MQIDSPNAVLALAGASGVTAHLFLYRHGEWDLQAPWIVVSYAALLFGAIAVEHLKRLEIAAPRHWAATVVGCHILGIYGSILVYRAFFHRLSRFPGPFLARISNFYATALSAKNLHLYEETEKLHKQYGDYVRLDTEVCPFFPVFFVSEKCELIGVSLSNDQGPRSCRLRIQTR